MSIQRYIAKWSSGQLKRDPEGHLCLYAEVEALQSRVAELEAALAECVRCVFYKKEITIDEHDKAIARASELLKEPK